MIKPIKRWQKEITEQALKTRRVLLLNGARQCGKTTLAKQIAKKDATYLSLDNITLKEFAEVDPMSFVQQEGKIVIIDEIQRVPSLLPAIKLVVDENPAPGQYLLTGSANIQSLPGVQESLAGRIRKIRLRPFAEGEINGIEPNFIDHAFAQHFSDMNNAEYNRKKLIDLGFRGGFPEAVSLEGQERKIWHRDYITALLEHDLKDIAHITRHHAMAQLVEVLAAWSGKFMDISTIGTGLAIKRPTLETYINALEALYITERVYPWTRTDYERVGKQSKLYMTDSGLMASLLRWNIEQVELDADRTGKLIETFTFNELAAHIDTSQGKYQLFHYRDREKREIDFIIEREDQALLGIEIKASSTISAADFKHLQWFAENLAKSRPFTGIVFYTGDKLGKMGTNLWAVPFANLFL